MGDIAPSPGRVLWVVPAMQRSAVCCDPRLLRRDTRAVPRIDLCFFFVAVESGVDNLQSLAFDLLDAD